MNQPSGTQLRPESHPGTRPCSSSRLSYVIVVVRAAPAEHLVVLCLDGVDWGLLVRFLVDADLDKRRKVGRLEVRVGEQARARVEKICSTLPSCGKWHADILKMT